MHLNTASTRMKKNRLRLAFVAAGTLIVLAPMAHATSTWLSNWRNIYPNSLSDDNSSCALCHNAINTSGSLNLYGSAVRSSGITGAQNFDSDGEGHTNLEEINANAQPAWTGTAPTGVVGDLDPADVVVNVPPTADAGGPYTANVGESIPFDGTGSTDSDGSISTYLWNFGDGTTASGSTPTHAYAVEGNYTVSLTVTDNDGDRDSDTTTATITVIDTSVAPIADAGGDYFGAVDQPLTLDGTASSDPDGGVIVQYNWNYGDGTAATNAGATPSHTYTSTGDFTITLTVTDDEGQTDSDTAVATIGAGELPPIADVGGPYTAVLGQTVTFDATGSRDPDGTVVIYDWNFGDGAVALDAGPTPSHLYTSAGTFNVSVTVYDNDGLSDSDSTTATITEVNVNVPPTADAGGPYSGVEDVAVSFNGSGSSDTDGSIVSYRWNFGDGSTGTGVSPSHTYANPGTYTVTLTVTDDAGDSDSDSTTATIEAAVIDPDVNLPPVADAGGPYSGVEDVAVRFDGSGSSDSDGSIISYRWYFGDGTSATGISPSHTYANPGTYTVTLIVTDNEYLRDYDRTTATITVASTSTDDDDDDDDDDRDDDDRDYDRDRD